MVQSDSEFWAKARRAQDELAEKFLNHPDVSLIDIGCPPEGHLLPEKMVLRIHVRDRWMQASPEKRVTFPIQIRGIPVVVIPGEYQFE